MEETVFFESEGLRLEALLDRASGDHAAVVTHPHPLGFMDFSKVTALPRLSLVVAGSRDDIGPPDMIRPYLSTWNPDAQLEIIPGADHFYSGALDALEDVLAKAF